MSTIRLIPRLDIKGENLVKGIHLEGLRVLGKPERFARYYYEQGADELIFMDAVASLYNRNSLLDLVRKTSSEIFIPLTVGGGLRSLEDIRGVLQAGADKVAINTAAVRFPDFIRQAAKRFGSSTIVVSIETMADVKGQYEIFTDGGREKTGINVYAWAQKAQELGAGELLITAIHREGTGTGFDVELIQKISELVEIPVIASGGAGKLEHIRDVISMGRVQAVALASILHYHLVKTHGLTDRFDEEINVEVLRQAHGFSKIQDTTIQEIRRILIDQGISLRIFPESLIS